MMKIIASLVILGLCANVVFGAAPTSSSNSAAIATTALDNSFVTTVLKGTNSTDSANWDSSTAAVTGGAAATSVGVLASDTWFGPGATNDTSYLWGVSSSAQTTTATTATSAVGAAGAADYVTVSAIRKRTISNTIVGFGNDTTQANVIADVPVTTTIYGDSRTAAVGPGYLAYLSTGVDGSGASANYQVWITLIGGVSSSSTTTKLTSTADVWESSATVPAVGAQCTLTTYTIGNIWYEKGAGAFFYTYSQNVESAIATTTGNAGTCGAFTGTGSSVATKIFLGGIYLNGTAYWTAPISVAAATAGNTVSSLMVGGNNWLNATNIFIIYKDSTADIIYKSTTAKASTTTAVGAFSSLIADPAAVTGPPAVTVSYSPVSIWASNFTYGITVTVTTGTTPSGGSTSTAYTYTNFLNGSSTGVDSGLASTTTTYPAGYTGWQLTTGYSILSAYSSQTSPYPTTYTLSNFYGNGTANGTAVTVGILSYSGPQLYEDVNGTMWIGWTDVDTANTPTYTYSAYLAKLQGQINVPSGASILSALSAFALFLAAIFVF